MAVGRMALANALVGNPAPNMPPNGGLMSIRPGMGSGRLAERGIRPRELQRNRTDDDCAIAATANLLSIPYEKAAAAFERPVDQQQGIPSSVDGKEPTVWHVAQVIERLGHPNQLVLGKVAPRLGIEGAPVASNAQLRSLLHGRAGIIMELDPDQEGHCLVFRGNRLVDPRKPGRRVQDFDALDVIGAVILK